MKAKHASSYCQMSPIMCEGSNPIPHLVENHCYRSARPKILIQAILTIMCSYCQAEYHALVTSPWQDSKHLCPLHLRISHQRKHNAVKNWIEQGLTYVERDGARAVSVVDAGPPRPAGGLSRWPIQGNFPMWTSSHATVQGILRHFVFFLVEDRYSSGGPGVTCCTCFKQR